MHRCVAVLALAICACRSPRPSSCEPFRVAGNWTVRLASPDGNRIEGVITSAESREQLKGTLTTREGTGEPLDFPIDSLRASSDSIHFRFAPAAIRVDGRCVTQDSIAASFEMLQPPFGPIVGRGYITRRKP